MNDFINYQLEGVFTFQDSHSNILCLKSERLGQRKPELRFAGHADLARSSKRNDVGHGMSSEDFSYESERHQRNVNSPLRDYWRTVYKNTCGLQRTIGVPTCKLGLSWLNN